MVFDGRPASTASSRCISVFFSLS